MSRFGEQCSECAWYYDNADPEVKAAMDAAGQTECSQDQNCWTKEPCPVFLIAIPAVMKRDEQNRLVPE